MNSIINTGCLVLISLLFCFLVVFLVYKLYENAYFNSKKFKNKKSEISQYIKECADLGFYMNEIKNRYKDAFSLNKVGLAETSDNSLYHMKRTHLTRERLNNYTYNCSLNIVKKQKNFLLYMLVNISTLTKTKKQRNSCNKCLTIFFLFVRVWR